MIYQITEAQRRDMLEALEWAIVALTDSINRESGKPWAKHLIDERATYWSLRDALSVLAHEDESRERPLYHECGGCGRVNNGDDDVCLCDMDRFRKERPNEYADMLNDGAIREETEA